MVATIWFNSWKEAGNNSYLLCSKKHTVKRNFCPAAMGIGINSFLTSWNLFHSQNQVLLRDDRYPFCEAEIVYFFLVGSINLYSPRSWVKRYTYRISVHRRLYFPALATGFLSASSPTRHAKGLIASEFSIWRYLLLRVIFSWEEKCP